MVSRRRHLVLGLALATCFSATALANDGPVNVILVMTDDQGYPDMGCHGNPVIHTPHMDRLAEAGVRFTDFHVNPLCVTCPAGRKA